MTSILIYLAIGLILSLVVVYVLITYEYKMDDELIGSVFLYILFLWPTAIIIPLTSFLCYYIGKKIRNLYK